MRDYTLTLVIDIQAKDIDEAVGIARAKVLEQGAKCWKIRGKLGGLEKEGDANG